MTEKEIEPAPKVIIDIGGVGRLKGGLAKWLAVVLAALAYILCQFFNFTIQPFGYSVDAIQFAYWTLALFVPCVILNHALKKGSTVDTIPWYDWLLSGAVFICFIYFGINSWEMELGGWSTNAPTVPYVMAWITILVMLSLAHRIYGTAFFVIVLFFTVYPLFADKLPGIFWGVTVPLRNSVCEIVLSGEGINGLPIRAAGKLIVSFMPFMLTLLYFGGGKFLTDLALSVIGTFRGAGGKVAVMASALMASISGGASLNVIVTGSVTIPMMKRTGYPAHYAGAIEACASTGGTVTPPIMGSAAFLIATFLLIPYWKVAIAAAIPAILYYICLFAQVDLYAKKANLKGLPRKELPSFWKTLRGGWYFIVPLILFVYLLLVAHTEAKSGFYSIVCFFVLYYATGGKERIKGLPRDIANIFLSVAKATGSIITLLGIVGLIIGGLSLTGTSLALSAGLISLSGGNVFLLLLMGAVTAYILGMGMTVTAVYVIVAILLAPALVQVGINPMAAHLFVLYWGMLSSITPPVAISCMVASRLANAPFFKTGFTAVGIGIGLLILPWFFVMSPALVLQELVATKFLLDFITCALGLIIISCGLQGIMYFISNTIGIPVRFFLFASGFLLAVPGWQTDVYGLILGAGTIAVYLLLRKVVQRREITT
ncbi:TRAP transporter permease [Chloroflexota bacterium]